MTRMYLQYLIIFLKSFSMLFFPNVSDHFLLALVNAFFLLLYLNGCDIDGTMLFLVLYLHPCECMGTETKNKHSHQSKCSATANWESTVHRTRLRGEWMFMLCFTTCVYEFFPYFRLKFQFTSRAHTTKQFRSLNMIEELLVLGLYSYFL